MSAESKLLVRCLPVKSFHELFTGRAFHELWIRQVSIVERGLLGSIQLLLIHEHSRLIEKDHHDDYIWNYYHTYKSNLVLRNWIFTKIWVTWTAILLMMIIEQSWTFMNFMITCDHVVWCHITTIVKHFLVFVITIIHDFVKLREMYRTLTLS